MRHLIRVWSGTAQDLNTFFLYDAFLSSSGVFLPLHGWQRRTGRHGRENIQIRISAEVTKVLLTQAPKNTEMLPVSVCSKKCKYYTNFTHCCFGWQWVLCKWNIIQIWVHRISEQHSYVHCCELCKSLCMPAWSDKALVFVLEWTQTVTRNPVLIWDWEASWFDFRGKCCFHVAMCGSEQQRISNAGVSNTM